MSKKQHETAAVKKHEDQAAVPVQPEDGGGTVQVERDEPAAESDPDFEPEPPAAEPEKRTLVRCNNGATETSPAAKELLLEACEKYGINPTNEQRPAELKAWNFLPGDRLADRPDAVVLVTHGGVKLKHYADPDYPMDGDTEDTLARWFGAFATDAKTREVSRVPLPNDMALPLSAVTGYSTKTEHRYRRGYLREGGKAEGDRRAKQQRKK